PFGEAARVLLQVSVVEAEAFRGIELVNSRAASLAQKELRDRAGIDRVNGSAAGRKDVHRLVAPLAVTPLGELTLHGRKGRVLDRHPQVVPLQLGHRVRGRWSEGRRRIGEGRRGKRWGRGAGVESG